MYPKSPILCRSVVKARDQQSGLGLVGAVFVIVVVALLAVAMARMLEADKMTQNYAILGLKAFLAAESGAQIGVNRLLAPDGTGACVNQTATMLADSLRFCTAQITCSLVTSAGESFYTVTSRGSCVAGEMSTSRALEVRINP